MTQLRQVKPISWLRSFNSAAYSSPMASQKVPRGLEGAVDGLDPFAGPVEVGAGVLVVVVEYRSRSRC